jgi:hypothetical protein
MGLSYNLCVLDPLGHELCTMINTNALTTIHLQLVYSNFLSFEASFHDVKSPKCSNLFLMMSTIDFII